MDLFFARRNELTPSAIAYRKGAYTKVLKIFDIHKFLFESLLVPFMFIIPTFFANFAALNVKTDKLC